MQLTHLLPLFLLAIAVTDFLVAMQTDTDGAAAASSSNTETKPHYHNVDYEGAIGSVRVGSSGEPTEFIFVDTHEKKAVDHGPPHHLKLKVKNQFIFGIYHSIALPWLYNFYKKLNYCKLRPISHLQW